MVLIVYLCLLLLVLLLLLSNVAGKQLNCTNNRTNNTNCKCPSNTTPARHIRMSLFVSNVLGENKQGDTCHLFCQQRSSNQCNYRSSGVPSFWHSTTRTQTQQTNTQRANATAVVVKFSIAMATRNATQQRWPNAFAGTKRCLFNDFDKRS